MSELDSFDHFDGASAYGATSSDYSYTDASSRSSVRANGHKHSKPRTDQRRTKDIDLDLDLEAISDLHLTEHDIDPTRSHAHPHSTRLPKSDAHALDASHAAHLTSSHSAAHADSDAFGQESAAASSSLQPLPEHACAYCGIFNPRLRRQVPRLQQVVLQLARLHLGLAHCQPPRPCKAQGGLPSRRVAPRRDYARMLQLRRQERLPARFHPRKERDRRRAALPPAVRSHVQLQGRHLGYQPVVAAHRGSLLPHLARQGAHRARTAPRAPHHAAADQPPRGSVEGQCKRQPRRPRQAWRRRGTQRHSAPIRGRLPVPEHLWSARECGEERAQEAAQPHPGPARNGQDGDECIDRLPAQQDESGSRAGVCAVECGGGSADGEDPRDGPQGGAAHRQEPRGARQSDRLPHAARAGGEQRHARRAAEAHPAQKRAGRAEQQRRTQVQGADARVRKGDPQHRRCDLLHVCGMRRSAPVQDQLPHRAGRRGDAGGRARVHDPARHGLQAGGLCGDHLQLGPVIMNKKAARRRLEPESV
ncbi:hypothetical protein L1887_48427 [Cichorium endivia]|nr:hypothetical protein L1887_48427 [Cichorium endivia]